MTDKFKDENKRKKTLPRSFEEAERKQQLPQSPEGAVRKNNPNAKNSERNAVINSININKASEINHKDNVNNNAPNQTSDSNASLNKDFKYGVVVRFSALRYYGLFLTDFSDMKIGDLVVVESPEQKAQVPGPSEDVFFRVEGIFNFHLIRCFRHQLHEALGARAGNGPVIKGGFDLYYGPDKVWVNVEPP